jgi:hypothetical protein
MARKQKSSMIHHPSNPYWIQCSPHLIFHDRRWDRCKQFLPDIALEFKKKHVKLPTEVLRACFVQQTTFPDQLSTCHHTTAFSTQQMSNSSCGMPTNKSISKCEDYHKVFPNCRTSLTLAQIMTLGLVHKLRVIVHHWCDPINSICRRYPMWMNGNCNQPF